MKASGWTLVTAPTEEPLSESEAKAHLRVSATDEDGLIGDYVAAARSWCEEYTGRRFVTQTWDAHFACWPTDGVFELPLPPLQSVTSIKYTNEGVAEATLSASVYEVITQVEPGRVILAANQSWPSGSLDVGLPVVVRFVCGYGLSVATPAGVRQAIRWLVGHMNENREAVSTLNVPPVVLPMGVRWALDPLRFRYIW